MKEMKVTVKLSVFVGCLMVSLLANASSLIIAHRGASGYAPEHSALSVQLAFAMGADYVEQDLVMTKDNYLIVLHDLYLEGVTDVGQRFAGRARADGHFYALDFTLSEIKTLSLNFRSRYSNRSKVSLPAVVAKEWQVERNAIHRIQTFDEALTQVARLNKSREVEMGVYPEIKSPSFHRSQGRDISEAVLSTLSQFGYRTHLDNVYLQSFDPIELKRINTVLLPQKAMSIKLIQLIAYTKWGLNKQYDSGQSSHYSYDWMFKPDAMQKISQYAHGIGPWHGMLQDKQGSATMLLKHAKAAGLQVHAYTFRADTDEYKRFGTFDNMLDIFVNKLKVDGLFTDHPDHVFRFLQ